MNLTNILNQIGLSDGQGNTSSMRVMMYFIIICVLAPSVYIAFKTATPLTITPDDLGLIGGALGFKCFQNTQENVTPPTAPIAPLPPTSPQPPKPATV